MEPTMDRPLLMTLTVAFLLVLLVLMLIGWRRRQRSQAGLPRPLALPADAADATMTVAAFYVATTMAGDPLNRIAVPELGYRARATLGVAEDGLRLAIPGQATILIPVSAIVAVEKATWTIDRAVEEDGLTLVQWTLGEGETATVVDSYFRVSDPAESDQFFETAQRLHDNFSQTGG